MVLFQLAFLLVNDFPKVLKTYRDARRNLGEIMSSCEFIDGQVLIFRSTVTDFQS